MGSNDWFTRTTWTPKDAAEFQARLKRSRGDANKAQYLRIQASRLAEVGMYETALLLTDQLLANHSVRFELASTHLQRAECFTAMGKHAKAIDSFRSALVAQRDFPNLRTGVALLFAWFIVVERKIELYDEVEPLLDEYKQCVLGLWFPYQLFKCAVVRALLAFEQGRLSEARAFVDQAMEAAGEKHSGFRYHSKFGLVGEIPADVAKRLEAIGSG